MPGKEDIRILVSEAFYTSHIHPERCGLTITDAADGRHGKRKYR